MDSSTNREYKNWIFPRKRAYVIAKEKGKRIEFTKEGDVNVVGEEIAFVPLCTKNVFSKLYTEKPSNMTCWGKDDAEAYFNDIIEKIKPFEIFRND